MRFSFQPREAYVITTGLSIAKVHVVLGEKFTTKTDKQNWWRLYYEYSSYMGSGDTFRIEKEIKENRTGINIVAIADLKTDNSVTSIFIQYDGYSPLLNAVLWPLTVLGAIGLLFTMWMLCTQLFDPGIWFGLFGSCLICGIPQLARLYYVGFIDGLHAQVLYALRKAQ